MFPVEDRAFLDIDVEALGRLTVLPARHEDVVAHLALDADISDQSVHGFGVDARQVAGVRVAVGVAVGHVEQQHEVVAAHRVQIHGGRRRGHQKLLLCG